jgi:hypothetical protein
MPQGRRLAVLPPHTFRAARAAAASALVVGACLGATGCGEDDSGSERDEGSQPAAPAPEERPTVDAARVEAALKKELNGIELFALPVPVYPPGGGAPQQTEVGGGRLKLRSVTCPPDVPLERGGTFTCELDGGDSDGSVELTQLNRQASSLRYKASIEGSGAGDGVSTTTELKGKLRVR